MFPRRFSNIAMKPARMGSTAAGRPVKLQSISQLLLDKLDVFLFDCDGVIWKGDSVIKGASRTLDTLRANGKRIFFVTNNSTKSRKGYLSKFQKLGLSVRADEIFPSSFAAAAYFEQNPLPKGKKVYIIGQEGIEEELDLLGIDHIGGPSFAKLPFKLSPSAFVEQDKDVAAVVVGFDQHINYYKIQYAQLCINENEGCKFIATNEDENGHLNGNQIWAGTGSMVGAIKGCTGRQPIVVGKPSPLMIDYLISKYNFDRSRMCMVGDRLDTDVLFGLDNGLKTILTLSGVTTKEQLLSHENKIVPDYYVESIDDLFP